MVQPTRGISRPRTIPRCEKTTNQEGRCWVTRAQHSQVSQKRRDLGHPALGKAGPSTARDDSRANSTSSLGMTDVEVPCLTTRQPWPPALQRRRYFEGDPVVDRAVPLDILGCCKKSRPFPAYPPGP